MASIQPIIITNHLMDLEALKSAIGVIAKNKKRKREKVFASPK